MCNRGGVLSGGTARCSSDVIRLGAVVSDGTAVGDVVNGGAAFDRQKAFRLDARLIAAKTVTVLAQGGSVHRRSWSVNAAIGYTSCKNHTSFSWRYCFYSIYGDVNESR